jgi:zinc protease
MLHEQLQAVAETGVTEEELALAKQYLLGLHRLGLQHLSGLAKRCALDELYGLGFDAWTQYEQRIQGVTLPMVQEAAKQYLRLSHRAEVIIAP